MKKDVPETINKSRHYVIGENTFRTKEEVERYIQRILYAYQLGETVNSEDARFLLALLLNHPKAQEKIGCGIQAFQIRQNQRFTTKRGFYLIHWDGTEDDFSFMKCIYPSPPLAIFKAICRKLIGRRMYWIKVEHFIKHENSEGKVQCPITRQWISRDQAHVDHAPPYTFERIMTEFLQTYGIQVDQVALKEAEGENEVGQTFADPLLAENWRAFHDARASFRIVSQWANLSVLKKENPPRSP
jgi:hypothetical protein